MYSGVIAKQRFEGLFFFPLYPAFYKTNCWTNVWINYVTSERDKAPGLFVVQSGIEWRKEGHPDCLPCLLCAPFWTFSPRSNRGILRRALERLSD